MLDTIPPFVGERLGFYVYLYVDPCTNEPFYVGKGQGQRALAHLGDISESAKVARIKEIRAAGLAPRIDILVHGLPSEETALRIEAAVIDTLGPDKLTNVVRGWETGEVGRMPLTELVALYGAHPVQVTHPSLLIRINRLYRYPMSPAELYDATRSCWKLGRRRELAKYAFAVFHSVVREVFQIDAWHPGGTTGDKNPNPHYEGRWEFVGKPAEQSIRSQYVGKSVKDYFKQGIQNPVVYVNCESKTVKR